MTSRVLEVGLRYPPTWLAVASVVAAEAALFAWFEPPPLVSVGFLGLGVVTQAYIAGVQRFQNENFLVAYLFLTSFFLLYVPFSKISHCGGHRWDIRARSGFEPRRSGRSGHRYRED